MEFMKNWQRLGVGSKICMGEVTKIRTGKLDANASSADAAYPFFTCSKEPLRISTYSYDCECVLVAGNGEFNVKYYNGKFDAYQRTYIIEPKDKFQLSVLFLYRFLEQYVDTLQKQAIGGVIKYIKLGMLADAEIILPSLEFQNKFVAFAQQCDKSKVNFERIFTAKISMCKYIFAKFLD